MSGRGNPNGFPLAAAYFRAHRKGMPRLHPFRKPKYRQIGVRGAKAWFCLRESFYKSIHEKSFKLRKLFSVIFRDNPPLRDGVASAAGFLSLRSSSLAAGCGRHAVRAPPRSARRLLLFPKSSSILFGIPVFFRSPLAAGGTRFAPRHARRGGSSSSQKVLRYFLGALCSGHALKSARKFTLSAEAAGMRPMGCALPKMRFWHAQEISSEILF